MTRAQHILAICLAPHLYSFLLTYPSHRCNLFMSTKSWHISLIQSTFAASRPRITTGNCPWRLPSGRAVTASRELQQGTTTLGLLEMPIKLTKTIDSGHLGTANHDYWKLKELSVRNADVSIRSPLCRSCPSWTLLLRG
jgi:hypothetical protein